MNQGRRPPLDELKALYLGDIAAEGVTTGPGNPAGNSFVDVALAGAGAGSYFPMLAILYIGDSRRIDSRETSGFNNVTGEVTLASAYKGIAAAIPAGVRYQLRTGKPSSAAVAAILANLLLLMADVGDASGSLLGSILGILGNPPVGQDIATRVGYEGATSLADKLTAAKAAFLNAAISSRAVPGDAMALTAAERLVVQALIINDLTPFAGADIDAAISSRAPSATALSTAVWTATIAGYINNSDLANIIRDIAQATGTFAFDESSALEQTAFSVVVAARSKVGSIWLDLNLLTMNVTIRVKHKIDGATYRTFTTHSWLFASDDKGVLLDGFTAYRDFQVTMQCAGTGAPGVNVPYVVV